MYIDLFPLVSAASDSRKTCKNTNKRGIPICTLRRIRVYTCKCIYYMYTYKLICTYI